MVNLSHTKIRSALIFPVKRRQMNFQCRETDRIKEDVTNRMTIFWRKEHGCDRCQWTFTWYGVLLKRGTLDRAENGIKVSYVLNYIDVHSFQSSSKRW